VSTPDVSAYRKTTGATTVAVGALIPQPHGGALRNGGTNRGGPGRPPDAVRAAYRELGATKGFGFISDLLDGKLAVSLLGKCDACEHEQPLSEEWVELMMNRIHARVDHMLRANEQALKVGLPKAKEMVIDDKDAAEFFDCVSAAALELFGEGGAAALEARTIELADKKTAT
jgi:hypothetical protein